MTYTYQRAERNHVAIAPANVELIDVVRVDAKLWFCLHQHAPGPAEPIEVVDVQTAEKRLERGIHVRHRHTERLRFVRIQIDTELRHRRAQSSID